MKIARLLVIFTAFTLITAPQICIAQSPLPEMDPAGYPAPNTGCLAPGKCHTGIEPIRAHNSEMAQQIYQLGGKLGGPNGCVICHGGNPAEEKDAAKAHTAAPQGGQLDTFVVVLLIVYVARRKRASS